MQRSIFAVAVLAAPLLGPLLATPALASSDDAWATFRTDVQAACAQITDVPEGASASYAVNPFGSESYGAALVTVTLKDGTADRMVCIYNKQNKTAEMTAPFGDMPELLQPAAATGSAADAATPPAATAPPAANSDAPSAKPATPSPTPAGAGTDSCDADSFRAYIGKPRAEVPIPDGANVRVLTPDMMVTMERMEGRVNLHVGTDGIVGDVTCG
ncbi:I78 family peptidase inhibitor [Paracoccus marinus]|uniref:I78 family peptidase inhibitor n=1 Tax=Paracoccus marinus TaxID=288426 RepID=UPI0010387E20|nr:I78 family peptidase inhibitor [Paracoccus marinus]GLS80320.1 hypothetical protein GCM10007893_11010 [Paracoccus marinus]